MVTWITNHAHTQHAKLHTHTNTHTIPLIKVYILRFSTKIASEFFSVDIPTDFIPWVGTNPSPLSLDELGSMQVIRGTLEHLMGAK